MKDAFYVLLMQPVCIYQFLCPIYCDTVAISLVHELRLQLGKLVWQVKEEN